MPDFEHRNWHQTKRGCYVQPNQGVRLIGIHEKGGFYFGFRQVSMLECFASSLSHVSLDPLLIHAHAFIGFFLRVLTGTLIRETSRNKKDRPVINSRIIPVQAFTTLVGSNQWLTR